MKLVPVLMAVMSFAAAAQAQQPFEIKGKIASLEQSKKVYISYYKGNNYHVDSSNVKNGVFTYKGSLEGPERVRIYVSGDGLYCYADPGKTIDIQSLTTLAKAHIKTEGKSQKEYEALQKMLAPLKEKAESFSILIYRSTIDDTTKQALRKYYRDNYEQTRLAETEFVRQNPNSIVSWEIIAGRGVIIDPITLPKEFELLSPAIKATPRGIDLAERIELAQKLQVGKPAIEFTLPDADGKMHSLSDLKGKYVLIDFWASWCGPCRAENPNMVRAYNELKGKGFEILGVSLDKDRAAWLKAVSDDKLPWLQVGDMKAFTTVAKTYGIKAIPQNLLIDGNGIILGTNIRGEQMKERIEKLIEEHGRK